MKRVDLVPPFLT